MKTIFSVLLLLFLNATTIAQHTKSHDKVYTTQMAVVLADSLPVSIHMEKVGFAKENGVARLYRYQNSRVKKALSFKTKKDKPKLA